MSQKSPTDQLPRRDFLKVGLAAGLGATTLGSGAPGAPNSSEAAVAIPKRRFGKTGLSLPILGFGGAESVKR